MIPDLKSVSMDPNTFPDPEKFDPTRFLDGYGKCCGKNKFFPFSIGKYTAYTNYSELYLKQVRTPRSWNLEAVRCWWFEFYRGHFFLMFTCSVFLAAGLAAFK